MSTIISCPAEEVLNLIKGKWKCAILIHLETKKARYNELNRKLPGVSQKVLSQQLKGLERDGLVNRTVYREDVPMKTYYTLTKLGYGITPIIKALKRFGIHQMGLTGCLNCFPQDPNS